MARKRSRSPEVDHDPELRLPRAPGVIRQYWARHPLFADILISLVCLFFSLGGAINVGNGTAGRTAVTTTQFPLLPATAAATAVVACAALLLRRRMPLVPFGIAVVAQLIFLASPSSAGTPLLAVTMYAVAVYGSSRLCWIAFGVGMGTIALGATIAVAVFGAAFNVGANVLLGSVVLALLGALIGVNVGNRKRYLQAVIDRSRQLVIERDQQAQLAAAAERARIAREMHDVVSHSLTVIVALSEGASATPDAARARDAMDAAAATARQALGEMRSMLGVLRDDDPDAPLAPLRPVPPHEIVAAAQQAGFPASLTATGDDDLPDALRYAIGRIVQEGVTNAMRHAPTATAIRVAIDRRPDAVTLNIRNDRAEASGAGASGAGGGHGLRGLSERIAHVGGTMTAGPDRAGGWLLTAVLPRQAASVATATRAEARS